MPQGDSDHETVQLIIAEAIAEASQALSDSGDSSSSQPQRSSDPVTLHHNPVFAATDLDDDMDTSMISQLQQLFQQGGSKFVGTTGLATVTWRESQLNKQLLDAAKASQQGRPVKHSSYMLSEVINSVQPHTTMHIMLEQLRSASSYDMLCAEAGFFPSPACNTQQHTLALGDRLGDAAFEKLLIDSMDEQLGKLCSRARSSGCLAVPEAEARDGEPSREPSPQAAVQHAVAAAEAESLEAQQRLQHLQDAAAAVRVRTLLDPRTGVQVEPHLAVLIKFLTLADVRFGTATSMQALEFNNLKQEPSQTAEEFAHKVLQYRRILRYKQEYTEAYAMQLFLQGLTDRSIADKVHASMLHESPANHTVQQALQYVRRAADMALQSHTVSIATQVAAQAVAKGSSSSSRLAAAGSSGAAGSSSHTPKQVERAIRDLRKQLPRDHDHAPCTMHPKATHTNSECSLQPERRHGFSRGSSTGLQPQQQQQQNPAAAGMYAPPLAHTPAAPPAPAAAASGPPPGLNPNTGQPYGWHTDSYQQHMQQQAPRAGASGKPRPAQTAPAAAGDGCRHCGHRSNHGGGACYFYQPNKAPATWAPGPRTPYALVQLYRQRCRDLGIMPKEPGTGAPPPARPGGAAMQEWDGEPEFEYDNLPPLPGACYTSPGIADTTAAATAGAATRSKQPLSFIPPAGVPLRTAAPPATADTTTGFTPAPVLSVTIQVGADQAGVTELVQRLLGMLPKPNTTGAAALAATDAPIAPAGECSSLEVELGSVPDVSVTAAAASSSSCSSSAGASQQEPIMLSGKPVSRHEFAVVAQQYLGTHKHPVLNHFVGTTPEIGVCAELRGGRVVLLDQAKEDNGCALNLMSEACANDLGVYVRPLKPDERPRMANIEGEGSKHIVGITEPLGIIFAKGTPAEVKLSTSFYVVRGEAAARMYGVILGRELLSPLAPFVEPLTQQFVYYPRLHEGNHQQHRLPVRPWLEASAPAGAVSVTHTACCGSVLPPPMQDACNTDAAASSAGAEEPALTSQQRRTAAKRAKRAARLAADREQVREMQDCFLEDLRDALTAPQPGRSWGSRLMLAVTLPSLLFIIAMPVILQLVGLMALTPVVLLDLAVTLITCNRVKTAFVPRMLSWARRKLTRKAPLHWKSYWRVGQYHRASDGERIRLNAAAFASGNKPVLFKVGSRPATMQHCVSTGPARMLTLLVMLLAFSVGRTVAMQVSLAAHQAVMSTQLRAGADVLSAIDMPAIPVGQLLAAELMQQHAFRGGRATCT